MSTQGSVVGEWESSSKVSSDNIPHIRTNRWQYWYTFDQSCRLNSGSQNQYVQLFSPLSQSSRELDDTKKLFFIFTKTRVQPRKKIFLVCKFHHNAETAAFEIHIQWKQNTVQSSPKIAISSCLELSVDIANPVWLWDHWGRSQELQSSIQIIQQNFNKSCLLVHPHLD